MNARNAKMTIRPVVGGGCKLWLAAAMALSLGTAMAATYNANNLDELTNAVARANGSDTIILASTRFDLSTLEPYTAADGKWGTMTTPDGYITKACLWFKKGLRLKGANDTSWRDKTSAQETILDGGSVACIIYACTGSGREASFHHLTFENGAANSGQNGGGAIYSIGPTLGTDKGIVSNCVFRNCSAQKCGGATYAYSVYDSLYENCSAAENGGGAWATGNDGYSGSHTNRFVGCEFRSCTAENGGGLYHETTRFAEGTLAGCVADCVFSNCAATLGGAIYEKDPGVVRGCRFENNVSNSGALYGLNRFDMTLVTNCTFVGNISRQDGGAIGRWKNVVDSSFVGNVASNSAGAATGCVLVERCGFTNNVALCLVGSGDSRGGGAITNVTAISCTFSGNTSARRGGAMYMGNATNCLFVGNSCVKNGGAIYDARATNCVFDANSSTEQGGASAWSGVTGCSFVNNSSNHRGGATYYGSALRCTFRDNHTSQNSRGSACAYTKATECTFSGVSDVSCGTYDRCVFDGVVSAPPPNSQKYVFDCLRHTGEKLYVTNCLITRCVVNRLAQCEGYNATFVNCTFADNTIDNNGYVMKSERGTDYVKNDKDEYRYFPGTNIVVNCLFSGNRFVNGNPADFAIWKNANETDFGYCSLQFYNCLYTEGVINYDHADVKENIVVGNPHFVAGYSKFPDAPYYSIRYASAARNAGANSAWTAAATDMAGNPRILDGTVDIGCYECVLPCEGTMLFIR